MKRVGLAVTLAAVALLVMLEVPGSRSGQHVQASGSPLCSMPAEGGPVWLPTTPEPAEAKAPDPRPASDCGFYLPAWQRFLVVTQPSLDGPAFLDYPSFDQIFTSTPTPTDQANPKGILRLSLTPRNVERPNESTPKLQELLDQTQAGIGGAQGGILIDQHGRFIYYAIHVNPAFLSFLRVNDLTTLTGLAKINPSLTFPPGVIELKSAWMIVENQKAAPTYFVVPAKVQRYILSNGTLSPELDKTNKPVFENVSAALIALHVVFTLPGHPEMIWSSFEHVRVDGKGNTVRDNAPAAPSNPSKTSLDTVISKDNFPLYKAGTTAANANKPIDGKIMAQNWDSNTQSFTKGGTALQTSVYRPYPGSKSDGTKADDSAEDDEVILINSNATKMFADAKARGQIADSDMRQHYRLVGAVWLNDPLLGPKASFTLKRSFENPINQTTDDNASDLAGEGRLGSTAMESFTEFEEGAPSCFNCHDTRAVRGKQGAQLLPPTLLNVSHVLSKFKGTPANPK
jgi:hypothetical protein